MPDDDLKALVLDYANGFNLGDIDAVCRLFIPNALIEGVMRTRSLEEERPIWKQLVTCFRIHLEVEMLIQEGFVVAARYTESGLFSAPFRGIEPTGRPYEIPAMEWFSFRNDGLILRRWGTRNWAAMFRQMGIPLRLLEGA